MPRLTLPINRLRKNRNRKLLLQVGAIVCAIFVVIMLLVGMMVYRGSKQLYLKGKNEMIDADLLRIRQRALQVTDLPWAFDYWQANPEKSSRRMTTVDSRIYEDIYYNGSDTKGNAVPAELSREDIEALTPEQQLAIAKYRYSDFVLEFQVAQYNYNYDSLYCIDVSEENIGLLYAIDTDEYDKRYSLGERWDYPVEEHPAVKEIRSYEDPNDIPKTLYEEARINGSDKRYYIGYTPIVIEGKLYGVICITYDWTPFRSTLNNSIFFMFAIGIVIMLISAALLLHFLHRSAIHPLRKIQKGVRNYMGDKDSAKIIEAMDKIKSQNEFGVLSDDIAELAEEIDRYNKENVRLVAEQERVAAELTLASGIQSHMLPKQFPDMPQFELYALMDPAKEVGGDFYDFFMIDDDRLGMVIADVSGKGVPASLFMMMSMIVLRNYARAGKSPSEVLRKANRSFCENDTDAMFVTVWFGILELSTGHVTAANAGHEYPMLRRADGGFELFKDKHGFVLGALPDMKYKDYEFDIEKGGTLFLYTDGAPEATNADQQLFGTDRMLLALNKAPDSSPQQLIETMTAAINDFVGDAPQFDDLTMLCVKYNGAQSTKATEE